jgi:2-polyprenyl-3-methyl-5-hydroxy-6-metoxy-1,4-benzoquinol methylase
MQRSKIAIAGQAALVLQGVLEEYLIEQLYRFLQRYAQPQIFVPADWGEEPAVQVLDVACRGGAWLCDLARQYPLIQVVGLEARRASVEAARMAAALAGLENVNIFEGDLLRGDQQEGAYRVVRGMFPTSSVSSEQEEAYVREMVRVCSPGGSLVLFEVDLPQTNSQAWNEWVITVGARLLALSAQGERLASLERHMLMAGCQQVERIVQELVISAGSAAHPAICGQFIRLFDLSSAFLLACKVMTVKQVMEMRKRLLMEVLDAGFEGIWRLVTVSTPAGIR